MKEKSSSDNNAKNKRKLEDEPQNTTTTATASSSAVNRPIVKAKKQRTSDKTDIVRSGTDPDCPVHGNIEKQTSEANAATAAVQQSDGIKPSTEQHKAITWQETLKNVQPIDTKAYFKKIVTYANHKQISIDTSAFLYYKPEECKFPNNSGELSFINPFKPGKLNFRKEYTENNELQMCMYDPQVHVWLGEIALYDDGDDCNSIFKLYPGKSCIYVNMEDKNISENEKVSDIVKSGRAIGITKAEGKEIAQKYQELGYIAVQPENVNFESFPAVDPSVDTNVESN
jgi:hypothetical protein